VLDVKSVSGRGPWTHEVADNHRRHMLLDEGLLDRLESVASVLTATLSPDRS